MQLPKRFGRAEIIDLIGWVATGVVYKVRDPVLDRTFALKVWSAPEGLPRIHELWLHEVRLLGSLDHPNIPKAYDVGTDGDRVFMKMQLPEGDALDLVVRRRQHLNLHQAIDVTAQISDALQYIHERGIVHRDVKPGNITLSPNGIATLNGFTLSCSDGNAPQPGSIVGTIPYMSPEQINGQQVGRRSDIFSLGCTFYELVEGRLAFEGPDSGEVIKNILHAPTPRSQKAQELRLPELQRIFDNALAKDKDERYASCAEFKVDLMRLKERLGS